MKSLENDCTIYVEQILAKTKSCYSKSENPSNADLLKLYSFIGKSICQQGEKAFVVYLAEIFVEKLPQLKGFSPRNLRRMRDFYKTYENQPELMTKAQTLSWTQNTVILECFKTNEQCSFYINLAKENKLSKLALMKAIKEDHFEQTFAEKSASETDTDCCPVVAYLCDTEGNNTTSPTKNDYRAFVPRCKPVSRILNQETNSLTVLMVIKILSIGNVLKWLRHIKNIKYKEKLYYGFINSKFSQNINTFFRHKCCKLPIILV